MLGVIVAPCTRLTTSSTSSGLSPSGASASTMCPPSLVLFTKPCARCGLAVRAPRRWKYPRIPWPQLPTSRFLPVAPPAPAAVDWHQVQRAAALLRGASKPLIWAGGGAVLAEASRELIALAEALGAPVATTAEGKGVFPEDHRLSLGVGYYGHGAASWAAPQADVVLAVGTRLTSQMAGLNALRMPQRLIHLDIDPTIIGKKLSSRHSSDHRCPGWFAGPLRRSTSPGPAGPALD